jgi:hypothetical protein
MILPLPVPTALYDSPQNESSEGAGQWPVGVVEVTGVTIFLMTKVTDHRKELDLPKVSSRVFGRFYSWFY